MTTYYEANIGRGTFEADNREKLIEKIASYYAESHAQDGERGSVPDADGVTMHTSNADGDGETVMSVEWLALFNSDLEEAYDEAYDGHTAPSDYEEHNTHWGL